MLKVWGRATSSNVQAAMWAAAEVGQPVERIDWGGKHGGNDDPAYLAKNPNGLVPVLEDGDVVLWESAAIVRYLGARYGSESFWPTDPGRRAPLDMWAEWTKTSVCPEMITRVFWQLVRTRPDMRDESVAAAGAEALKTLMPRLDARLSEGDFLGGGDVCFADILAGHVLYRYMTLEFPKAETPHVDAYYARLCRRPAYREHVMISYDSLRPA